MLASYQNRSSTDGTRILVLVLVLVLVQVLVPVLVLVLVQVLVLPKCCFYYKQ